MAASTEEANMALWNHHHSDSSSGSNTKENSNNGSSSKENSNDHKHNQSDSSSVRKRKRTTTTTPGSLSLSSSSSSSSSSSDEEDETSSDSPRQQHQQQQQQDQLLQQQHRMQQPEGWRVKLYRLNADGSWDDCGTGRIACLYKTMSNTSNSSSPNHMNDDQRLYQELGEPTLCMHAEAGQRVLLRTRILLRDAYQRQGENIITWCEPYFEDKPPPVFGDHEQPPPGVDLALSFQDNAGCLDVWSQITNIQKRADEWYRSSVTDMALASAAAELQHHRQQQQQHHQQQQQQFWGGKRAHLGEDEGDEVDDFHQEADAEAVAVSMAAAAAAAYGKDIAQLPQSPTLSNLEEIADTIAASQQQLQHRESLAMFISQSDCAYLKALLGLFPSAEARSDYGALATLAACIKTILLMNDPSIIDLIVTDVAIYEQVCSVLEYDPDLRDKANHRWFLKERAKFRTVVLMENEELISTIHRSFRVTYLRDTLLRPTMDESSLSTLSSLQTFTHADVVKGVTCPPANRGDSYLVQVMSMLGREVYAIAQLEWEQLETNAPVPQEAPEPVATVVPGKDCSWKQHLAPQDMSLTARRIRRRGCLSFFRELFNMVRISLQQSDKDDFYTAIVCMEVQWQEDETKGHASESPVYFLSILGMVLSDPAADLSEKGAVLEVIAAIAMHDPSHIRRHCLEFFEVWKRQRDTSGNHDGDMRGPGRPTPNERRQIMFRCVPNDLLASLLFLLAIETDAGLLLQTSEIMRIILDTDMLGEYGPMSVGVGVEEVEGIPPGMHNFAMDHMNGQHAVSSMLGSNQNQFLAMFYEYYIQWLVAPFQYTVLHTARRVPTSILSSPSESTLFQRMMETFKNGVSPQDTIVRVVPVCAIRSSFAVELLTFCVRAHLYRMKYFLLRSRVLGGVLKLLLPSKVASGDRCLKLSALRLLRSVISVKDEFYHRHIIQHNLFGPVFEAFRANPVGDNLVSSAIIEMCDFIHNHNIKSLLEYIVTRHLSVPSMQSNSDEPQPSLEDVATPYVTTLTMLRKTYEEGLNNAATNAQASESAHDAQVNGSLHFPGASLAGPTRVAMSEKAVEDQRKFREADEDESYFESDDDDEGGSMNMVVTREASPPPMTPLAAVDEVETSQYESDLHRTPRMFSLAQASIVNVSQVNHGMSVDQNRCEDAEMEVTSGNETYECASVNVASPQDMNCASSHVQ